MSYEKYPDNIVYHKLEEDPGIYGVWNMGVEMATGEFLTNANLDDRKAPHALEAHARALYADPTVDLVYGDITVVDITEGATHYHADYVYPSWRKTKTKTIEIEDHIFYRWEK